MPPTFPSDPTPSITERERRTNRKSDLLFNKSFAELAHPVSIVSDLISEPRNDGFRGYYDIDDVLAYYTRFGTGRGYVSHPLNSAVFIHLDEVHPVTWPANYAENTAYVAAALRRVRETIPPVTMPGEALPAHEPFPCSRELCAQAIYGLRNSMYKTLMRLIFEQVPEDTQVPWGQAKTMLRELATVPETAEAHFRSHADLLHGIHLATEDAIKQIYSFKGVPRKLEQMVLDIPTFAWRHNEQDRDDRLVVLNPSERTRLRIQEEHGRVLDECKACMHVNRINDRLHTSTPFRIDTTRLDATTRRAVQLLERDGMTHEDIAAVFDAIAQLRARRTNEDLFS